MTDRTYESLLKNLRCPTTGLDLREIGVEEAGSIFGGELTALRTNGREAAKPIGLTRRVLIRSDEQVAYPIVDRTPILLAPESLGAARDARSFDLLDPAFEEAYLEMDFYNHVGREEAHDIKSSEGWKIIRNLLAETGESAVTLLEPPAAWLDAIYDSAAQADVYQALGPVKDGEFAQIGGKGIHAVKFLLAGAKNCTLVTPMLGEALCAIALASEFGVSERLSTVVAVAEQLPFCSQVFDGIFVGGSAHHMDLSLAMPQIFEVLREGGSFGAVEPYRAPLYNIGTRILGKREANAHCSPLDDDRLKPFLDTFDNSDVIHHGTLTRYPLLALWKLGVRPPFGFVWRLNHLDDAVCARSLRLRKAGSSIALIGTR